jgi:hypothetical protein
MRREKLVVFMYSRHEYAVRAFKEHSERLKGWPDLEFNRTSLTITGQGIRQKFTSVEGDKLRGMEIDKIFFDDVGPFWGDRIVDDKLKAR